MESRSPILLLGSGTQALAVVKKLAKAGYIIDILTDESGNYADVSRYIHKRFICSLDVRSDAFLNYIEHLIQTEGFDAIIPMGDTMAEFISKNKETLHEITHLTAPEYDSFLKGYDKNQLMSLCKEKGYPHPQTIDLSQVDISSNVIKLFPYPAILKPNCTTGGRGMVLVNNHQELLEKYPAYHSQYGEYHLQRFIPEGGRQVKIQLFVSSDGQLVASSALHKVRWYPIKGGSSSCAVTIEEKTLTTICHQILKDIHWEGFADFDLIEDPLTHELLIMEMNPRLPACIGAAIHAGLDWGQIIVDYSFGKTPQKYGYKNGVALRHLGFDCLWFLKSPHRFDSCPSWFQFFGKNVFYQDMDGWTDMKPFIIGTFHNIKKLFDPSFKSAKSI